jgi:hypothetical protein
MSGIMMSHAAIAAQAGASGGGAGPLITGTITVGEGGFQQGYVSGGVAGSANLTPAGALTAIAYNSSSTQIGLPGGTYGNVTTVFGSNINGSSTFTLTVDGIAQQAAMSVMGISVPGDPYGLASKVGQTLTVSLAIP